MFYIKKFTLSHKGNSNVSKQINITNIRKRTFPSFIYNFRNREIRKESVYQNITY